MSTILRLGVRTWDNFPDRKYLETSIGHVEVLQWPIYLRKSEMKSRFVSWTMSGRLSNILSLLELGIFPVLIIQKEDLSLACLTSFRGPLQFRIFKVFSLSNRLAVLLFPSYVSLVIVVLHNLAINTNTLSQLSFRKLSFLSKVIPLVRKDSK